MTEEFDAIMFLKENRWSSDVQDIMIAFISDTIQKHPHTEVELYKALLEVSAPS